MRHLLLSPVGFAAADWHLDAAHAVGAGAGGWQVVGARLPAAFPELCPPLRARAPLWPGLTHGVLDPQAALHPPFGRRIPCPRP